MTIVSVINTTDNKRKLNNNNRKVKNENKEFDI